MAAPHDPERGLEPELTEGSLVAEKYLVGAPIGRGGTAAVFRAHGRPMQRDVALKIQTDQSATDRSLRLRFLREMRLLASIDHPSVVKVFEVGMLPDGSLIAALELIEGRTVLQVLRDEGRLPAPQVVVIAAQLLSALAVIHERDVVHRDIKPSNVMLAQGRRGLRVKLIDFGVARRVNEADRGITAPSDVVGTPGYLSPEQVAAGSMVDTRTDLFSLGVLLFEALVGHKPFGNTGSDLVRAMASGEGTDRTRLREVASEALVDLVASLCEAEPSRRPQTAAEALLRLQTVPEADEVSLEPERSSRPPASLPPQVLVVSPSKVRRTAWGHAVTRVGGAPLLVAGLDAAVLLLQQTEPPTPNVVLLEEVASAADGHAHAALLALGPSRLGRIIYVRPPSRGSSQLDPWMVSSDPRAVVIAMPVTQAELAPLLSPSA